MISRFLCLVLPTQWVDTDNEEPADTILEDGVSFPPVEPGFPWTLTFIVTFAAIALLLVLFRVRRKRSR